MREIKGIYVDLEIRLVEEKGTVVFRLGGGLQIYFNYSQLSAQSSTI